MSKVTFAKFPQSEAKAQETYLIYGAKTGWLGSLLAGLLREQNQNVIIAEARIEEREKVAAELDKYKPDYVLNCAGVTSRPNVDWCEDHKQETIRSNVVGTLNLADLTSQRNIHMTNYATGCIYEYDAAHPLDSGKGFTEEDVPNFHGSFYAHTKAMVEELIRNYPNVLTLRVRMPISDDLHPRNFITKIIKYEKVVNVPNSMTVLHEMLPISIIMTQRRLKGVYNFTNPGVVSHNQILDLYTKYVDPSFKYKNFTLEEQAKILKAGRSNNELDTTKLTSALPDIKIPHIQESIVGVLQRMGEIEGKKSAQ